MDIPAALCSDEELLYGNCLEPVVLGRYGIPGERSRQRRLPPTISPSLVQKVHPEAHFVPQSTARVAVDGLSVCPILRFQTEGDGVHEKMNVRRWRSPGQQDPAPDRGQCGQRAAKKSVQVVPQTNLPLSRASFNSFEIRAISASSTHSPPDVRLIIPRRSPGSLPSSHASPPRYVALLISSASRCSLNSLG